MFFSWGIYILTCLKMLWMILFKKSLNKLILLKERLSKNQDNQEKLVFQNTVVTATSFSGFSDAVSLRCSVKRVSWKFCKIRKKTPVPVSLLSDRRTFLRRVSLCLVTWVTKKYSLGHSEFGISCTLFGSFTICQFLWLPFHATTYSKCFNHSRNCLLWNINVF